MTSHEPRSLYKRRAPSPESPFLKPMYKNLARTGEGNGRRVKKNSYGKELGKLLQEKENVRMINGCISSTRTTKNSAKYKEGASMLLDAAMERENVGSSDEEEPMQRGKARVKETKMEEESKESRKNTGPRASKKEEIEDMQFLSKNSMNKSQSTVPSKKRGEHLSESMTESHAESKTGEFEEIRRRPVSKDTKKNAPRRQGRLETSESAESESEMIEEKLHKPTLTKKVKEQASKPSTKKPKEKSTSERIAMAKQALLESTVPANLLGREEECHEIQKFLKDALKNKGMPETLYISGTPGIGKTACCLRELEKFCSAHKNEVVQIYMNGLHMSHPENTYSYILKELTGIGNLSVAASANALGTPHFKLLFLPFIH
jgi:hypothetical protein